MKTKATLYWFTVAVVGLLKTETVHVRARDLAPDTIKGIARAKMPGGLAYNIIGKEVDHE